MNPHFTSQTFQIFSDSILSGRNSSRFSDQDVGLSMAVLGETSLDLNLLKTVGQLLISAPHARKVVVKGTEALLGLSIECERIESLVMKGCESIRKCFEDEAMMKRLYRRCPLERGDMGN